MSHRKILKQNVLWTDDTPVMFFDRNGKPVQTKKGQSSLRRGRFWPYIARGDAPYTVFDFTEASCLTGTEFRKLVMSLATQLPEDTLTTMLPDHWAAANPKQVLVHRIEEARQVANRKRDDRQKRREKNATADLRPANGARN